MPEQPDDDGLVPPIKVMRKRLNGVYSAEQGFTGSTRRYVLIVAMLVGLASLPTLAAITAGSREIDNDRGGAMGGPFIPPASTGPVRTPSAPATAPPTKAPAGSSLPGGAGPLRGHAQKRKTKPKGYGQSTNQRHPAPGAAGHGFRPSGSGSSGSSGVGSSGGSGSGGSWSGGPADPGRPPVFRPSRPGLPQLPVKPAVPDESEQIPELPGVPHIPDAPDPTGSPDSPDTPDLPDLPGPSHGSDDGDVGDGGGSDDGDLPPAKPVHPPWCLDRTDCSAHTAQHHPGRPRHRHCDDSAHRSHSREDRKRSSTVHITPTDSRRRSAVTERPQNVRPARGADRTHNSHRYQPSEPERGESTHTAAMIRAYRGSHRAERMHRPDDDTGARHRGSRVGRHHHLDQPRQDHQNRW